MFPPSMHFKIRTLDWQYPPLVATGGTAEYKKFPLAKESFFPETAMVLIVLIGQTDHVSYRDTSESTGMKIGCYLEFLVLVHIVQ